MPNVMDSTLFLVLPSSGGGGSPTYSYVYNNGNGSSTNYCTANWAHDLSFGITLNGHDTSNPEPGETYALSGSSGGGGWQPASTNYSGVTYGQGPYGLDVSAYTWMTFDINTAGGAANGLWNITHYVGSYDGSNGATDTVTPALPTFNTLPGFTGFSTSIWKMSVRMPMAAIGWLGNHACYKFQFKDNNGYAWLVDKVGFVPGNYEWIHDGGSCNGIWTTSGVYGGGSWGNDAATLLNGWSDSSATVNGTATYNQSPTGLSTAGSLTGLTQPGISAVYTSVIKVVTSTANGGWFVIQGSTRNISAYSYITFAILPTSGTHSWSAQFYGSGGSGAIGNAVTSLSGYTSNDYGNGSSYWTVYWIPLTAFGSIGSNIGGFQLIDTATSGTTFYITAPGFFS